MFLHAALHRKHRRKRISPRTFSKRDEATRQLSKGLVLEKCSQNNPGTKTALLELLTPSVAIGVG